MGLLDNLKSFFKSGDAGPVDSDGVVTPVTILEKTPNTGGDYPDPDQTPEPDDGVDEE